MAGVLKYHNGSAWVPVSYPTATSSQAGVIKLADNVTTTTEGEYALDAYQGKVLQDQIDNISIDYVVEQGTSGIWTYRKWNSGIAECWGIGTWSATSSDYSTFGSMYYYNIGTFSYPSNLFISSPCVTSYFDSGNGGWLGVVWARGSETTTPPFGYYRPNAGVASGSVYIEAKGKWE